MSLDRYKKPKRAGEKNTDRHRKKDDFEQKTKRMRSMSGVCWDDEINQLKVSQWKPHSQTFSHCHLAVTSPSIRRLTGILMFAVQLKQIIFFFARNFATFCKGIIACIVPKKPSQKCFAKCERHKKSHRMECCSLTASHWSMVEHQQGWRRRVGWI